jgi:hypothetical protein
MTEEEKAGLNTIPPKLEITTEPKTEVTATTTTQTEKPTETVKPETSATTTVPPTTEIPSKVDEFIEILNKKFGTTYKAEDEVKGLFELPKKVTEYEGQLKEFDTIKGQVESYKKELDDLKNQGYSEFLSKPLIQKAYVAQQLLEKYPDKDPFMMQEIAMSEVDKMDDLEVVAKERKIRYPGVKLENQKAIILNELGIDPATTPEEWDSLAKDKLTMMAGDARLRIKELTNGVEIPKYQTKEEREKLLADALQRKIELTTPIKERFCQFNEFVNKKGDFRFEVPNEYKEKIPDLFQGMFIDAGLEVNEENLTIAEKIKRSNFLDEYFDQMMDIRIKEAQAIVQARVDAELNNTVEPKTQTATDTNVIEELPRLDKIIQDDANKRVTKL